MKINLPTGNGFRGLGAYLVNDLPTIYYKTENGEEINLAQSTDGLEFEKTSLVTKITGLDKLQVKPSHIIKMRISPLFKNYLMFYKSKFENKVETFVATSENLLDWQTVNRLPTGTSVGVNVDNYVFNDKHVFYFGGNKMRLGYTEKGVTWEFVNLEVSNAQDLQIDFCLKTSQGIFVLYHQYSHISNERHLEVKAVLFDRNDPTKVLWHTNASLWEEPTHWHETSPYSLGAMLFEGRILSYWNVPGVGIYTVTYPFFGETPTHDKKHFELSKHPQNPILYPNSKHDWENEAVFNAAAFHDGNKVYLIYRAVGTGYISVLGYAESEDGVNFAKRLSEPIFTGNDEFDSKKPEATFESARHYISGGGYGGCEDPRISRVGNKLYMIYVAFNGFDPPRLALTSILYKDFINHRFLWEKPVLISPPGVVDKSGCVLPEKINGKFVVFHRIYPNILIDFFDDLDFDGTKYLKGEFKISPRPTMWDSRKVGVGAPPIKTKDGWLLIYQGVNDKDDSKYRIGAMLLDLNDPTKVLYRTNHPIIEPTEFYENNLAKFGVVYPCGAVIKDGILFVYYGGSDSVTCVATANLEEFLKEIKSGSDAKLSPVKITAQ